MRHSEQINELAKALAAAQGEFSSPDRNREVKVATKNGGSYSFRYSTLDCVMDMARPILSKHGLAVTQPPTVREGQVIVLTRLMHASGQWQEEEIPVRPEAFGPQQIGSAITYLKRYAYCGMLGIASDEDDGGNAASGNHVEESNERARPSSSLPNCPKCGNNKAVIRGKEEYGGGYVCFRKKDGCGHNWHDEPDPEPTNGAKARAKQVAGEHGMRTGAELAEEAEMKAYGKFQAFLACVWTEDGYDKFLSEFKKESTQSLAAKLKIADDDAKRRLALTTAKEVDADLMEQIGIWIGKTTKTKDLERFVDWALNADASPFTDDQKSKLYKWLERELAKHGQHAGTH